MASRRRSPKTIPTSFNSISSLENLKKLERHQIFDFLTRTKEKKKKKKKKKKKNGGDSPSMEGGEQEAEQEDLPWEKARRKEGKKKNKEKKKERKKKWKKSTFEGKNLIVWIIKFLRDKSFSLCFPAFSAEMGTTEGFLRNLCSIWWSFSGTYVVGTQWRIHRGEDWKIRNSVEQITTWIGRHLPCTQKQEKENRFMASWGGNQKVTSFTFSPFLEQKKKKRTRKKEMAPTLSSLTLHQSRLHSLPLSCLSSPSLTPWSPWWSGDEGRPLFWLFGG